MQGELKEPTDADRTRIAERAGRSDRVREDGGAIRQEPRMARWRIVKRPTPIAVGVSRGRGPTAGVACWCFVQFVGQTR
jgi:hypothetical protein